MEIKKGLLLFQKLEKRLNLLFLLHKPIIKMDSKAVKLKTVQK